MDVSCIPQSGFCFLFVPYFCLSNVQKIKIFITLYSGTVRPKRLNLVHLSTMGGCIVYTRIRLMPLICPFISSVFFLSNCQTLTIFVTSRTTAALLRHREEEQKNEPRHDKTNKMSVHPAKTQISLGIHQSYQSSLCAQWVAKDPSFFLLRMPRLI